MQQGRIIHEAGEAEASGARTAWYNENLQSRTTLGPKISKENLQSSKFFAKRHFDPSSRSATIHPATREPTNNKFSKQSSIAEEKVHLEIVVFFT